MKKFLSAGIIVSALLGTGLANIGVAQEVEESYSEDYYTYGKVLSISPKQITIEEYDLETEKDVSVTYIINAQTKVDLNSIAVGDDVEIDYKEENGQKIATVIAKEIYTSSEYEVYE